MKPYVVSPDAADELTSIWLYLEHEYGEEFADKTMRRLVHAFAELAETPGMGRLRPEWRRSRKPSRNVKTGPAL